MSGSTPILDLLTQGQSGKEITANALFDAASPATLFGRRQASSSGLTWGYYGGAVNNAGTITQIANGTLTLPASATNYVQASKAGVVSANTAGFTAGQIPLYTVVTGTATVSSYTDHRAFLTSAMPPQYTTAAAPAWTVGGMYFDTTLNKLRIGGASAWETVTSA